MSKRTQRIIQGVAALFFVGCLICFITLVWPFAPHQVYGYEGLDTPVCPNDSVRVWTDKKTSDRYEVDAAHVASYWKNVDTGDSVGSVETAIPLKPTAGRVTDASPIERDAPQKPGEYRMVADITVEGRVLFMPRYQRIHAESDQALEVLSKDDPRCDGEAR